MGAGVGMRPGVGNGLSPRPVRIGVLIGDGGMGVGEVGDTCIGIGIGIDGIEAGGTAGCTCGAE